MQVACDQLKHQSKHPDGQPSELILFPKLRIDFADFPYLLCPEAARLGDLMQLRVRTGDASRPLSAAQGQWEACRTPQQGALPTSQPWLQAV